MGWVCSSCWKSEQDVLDYWTNENATFGYTVHIEGNWAYVEKNGDPVDLIYIFTQKMNGEWGYKNISVTCGPFCYSAPLWMVLRIHPIFKNSIIYEGWLSQYPNKVIVLLNDRQTFIGSLFGESV